MKTKLKAVLVTVATILVLTQCKKDNTIYNAYFFTDKDASEARLSLYIDDEYKGELPILKTKPTCDNDTLKQRALFLLLKAGKHKITAKDDQGTVKSSGNIKITNNSTSTSGGVGGQEISVVNDCVIIGLSY